MIESKRFNLDNFDNDREALELLNTQAEIISDLEEENEQLKSELRTLRDFRGFITEKNVFNEEERRKLELQMLRLYNYFEDCFEDTMSSSSFSEMWDTVKESEKWEKR